MSQRRAVGLLVALGLCACGGSGDGGGGSGINLANFQAADVIVGQTSVNGGATDNGGTVNQIGLDFPIGHVGNGSLYVADASNSRVLGWNAAPTGLGQPADFVIGQASFTSNGPGTTATTLSGPASCWVAGGALFVADSANGRVLVYGGPPTSNVAASIALGKPDLTTGGFTNGPAGLGYVPDVCVAGNRIVVADQGNRRVLIWNGVPGASGAAAQLVLGQPDFVTFTPGTTAAKMASPTGVWTDGTRLAVADGGNDRVLIWTTFPTANGQAADVVVGQADFTSSNFGAGSQNFNGPQAVASDGAQLFVTDQGNNRVLRFSPFPTSSNPAAVGVLGQSNFTNGAANDDDQDSVTDVAPSARTLTNPSGITVVGNRLYVADSGNNRVLVFTGS